MKCLQNSATDPILLNFFKNAGALNLSFSIGFISYIYSIYIQCGAFNYTFIYRLEDITFALYTEG
jgi:hypothetical protein